MRRSPNWLCELHVAPEPLGDLLSRVDIIDRGNRYNDDAKSRQDRIKVVSFRHLTLMECSDAYLARATMCVPRTLEGLDHLLRRDPGKYYQLLGQFYDKSPANFDAWGNKIHHLLGSPRTKNRIWEPALRSALSPYGLTATGIIPKSSRTALSDKEPFSRLERCARNVCRIGTCPVGPSFISIDGNPFQPCQ